MVDKVERARRMLEVCEDPDATIGQGGAAELARDVLSLAAALADTEERCCATYWCPTAGEVECPHHGGFDTCCDRPELHVPIAEWAVAAEKRNAELEAALRRIAHQDEMRSALPFLTLFANCVEIAMAALAASGSGDETK